MNLREVIERTLQEYDSMTYQSGMFVEPIFKDSTGAVGPVRQILSDLPVKLLDAIIEHLGDVENNPYPAYNDRATSGAWGSACVHIKHSLKQAREDITSLQ